MRDTLGLCDGSHIAFQARQRSATGERKKLGDRDMKFVTWHSSDGRLGEGDVCSSLPRTQTIVAWAVFKYWTFLKRNGDVLLISLYA